MQNSRARSVPADARQRTRNSLKSAIARCSNPNAVNYRYYGGRGIRVCDRWRGRGGLANIIADLGPRPEGHTLDRIDNDGDYAPENCRWLPVAEQLEHRRNVEMLEHEGKRLSMAGWARELGKPHEFVRRRVRVHGMTIAAVVAEARS